MSMVPCAQHTLHIHAQPENTRGPAAEWDVVEVARDVCVTGCERLIGMATMARALQFGGITTVASAKQELVLIPGLLCTAELFAPQTAALKRTANITFGEIDGHTGMRDMARAILAKAPLKFALAGLSMGGYVAFEVLRQAPDRVTKLALLDTNARADRPEQGEQRRALVELARAEG